MTDTAAAAVVGLGAAVLVLTTFLVVARAVAAGRRSRRRPLRDRFELELALLLATDAPPPVPTSAEERRILRGVALDALSELRGRERERVTTMLEQSGIVDDAVAELRSRRPAERRRGADTLAHVRSPRASDALLRGLADPDRTVALACARGLMELGEESALAQVLPIAEDAAAHAPGAAAELLLALGAHLPHALDDVYRRTRSRALRRLAIAVIGELRLADHAGILRDALRSDDDELVARAVRGLAAIGDADAFPQLLDLLATGDRALFVRVQAAAALGRLGDTRAAPALERALNDTAWSLRERAAVALAELGAAGRPALERAAAGGHVHAKAALA